MEESHLPGSGEYEALPGEHVTIDQVVAMNMRRWRRAAGMTQEELGELLGWSPANVSSAERSASESRDRRRFDAHTLVAVATALGVPLIALFLPPEGDGHEKRYLYHLLDQGGACLGMTDLMRVVLPDSDDKTPQMDVYRERLRGDVTHYADEEWGREAARWVRRIEGREAAAERAARLRSASAGVLDFLAEVASIADALESDPDGDES